MKWEGIPVGNGVGKECELVIVFESGDLHISYKIIVS